MTGDYFEPKDDCCPWIGDCRSHPTKCNICKKNPKKNEHRFDPKEWDIDYRPFGYPRYPQPHIVLMH